MLDCWLQIHHYFLWQCVLWWLVANFLTNQLALVHSGWLTAMQRIPESPDTKKITKAKKWQFSPHIKWQHTDGRATQVDSSKVIFTNQWLRTSACLEQSVRHHSDSWQCQDIWTLSIHWYLDPLVLGSTDSTSRRVYQGPKHWTHYCTCNMIKGNIYISIHHWFCDPSWMISVSPPTVSKYHSTGPAVRP